MLAAISSESLAEGVKERVRIDSAFASYYGDNATRVLNDLYKAVERIRAHSEFDSGVDKLPVVTDSMKAMVELYESLNTAGLMEPESFD